MFGYEASVGGNIPIIRILNSYIDNITEIKGILNGTTNFILTKMAEEGLSYKEALKQAQDIGFAEADPTFDVDGHDSAQKLYVLAKMVFGSVNYDDISIKGIRNITKEQIEKAKENGCELKLVASAKKTENGI